MIFQILLLYYYYITIKVLSYYYHITIILLSYYYHITIILLSYYYHAGYSHTIPILFPLLRKILACERFTPCFTFGAFCASGPNGRWASQQCPLPAAGPGDFWAKNTGVFVPGLVNIQKTMENHQF